MLDDIIRELDLDPAHPQLDQYRAAIAQVDRIADRFGRLRVPGQDPPVVLRLDRPPAPPPPIRGWLERYAADFADGRVRRCRHSSWFTPTTMYAGEPGRAFCPACDRRRGHELQQNARETSGHLTMDCDFCGVPTDPFALRIVAVPVVTILVRGMACRGCLP